MHAYYSFDEHHETGAKIYLSEHNRCVLVTRTSCNQDNHFSLRETYQGKVILEICEADRISRNEFDRISARFRQINEQLCMSEFGSQPKEMSIREIEQIEYLLCEKWNYQFVLTGELSKLHDTYSSWKHTISGLSTGNGIYNEDGLHHYVQRFGPTKASIYIAARFGQKFSEIMEEKREMGQYGPKVRKDLSCAYSQTEENISIFIDIYRFVREYHRFVRVDCEYREFAKNIPIITRYFAEHSNREVAKRWIKDSEIRTLSNRSLFEDA